MPKYFFPSPLATHIVDRETNKMVIDVPKKNDEFEAIWEARKLYILTWLNNGKIYLPPVS